MLKALRRATILGSSVALSAGLVLSSASAFAAGGGANMDKVQGVSYYVSSSAGDDKIPVPARINRLNLWLKSMK